MGFDWTKAMALEAMSTVASNYKSGIPSFYFWSLALWTPSRFATMSSALASSLWPSLCLSSISTSTPLSTCIAGCSKRWPHLLWAVGCSTEWSCGWWRFDWPLEMHQALAAQKHCQAQVQYSLSWPSNRWIDSSLLPTWSRPSHCICLSVGTVPSTPKRCSAWAPIGSQSLRYSLTYRDWILVQACQSRQSAWPRWCPGRDFAALHEWAFRGVLCSPFQDLCFGRWTCPI